MQTATDARTERLDELIRLVLRNAGIPALAMLVFLGLWSAAASRIQVSFGSLPGPSAVATEVGQLWRDHKAERAKEAAFYERQAGRMAAFLAKTPGGKWTERKYAGRPTFFDQILTSLKTVFTGFIIASLIAVPLGIVCGLSKAFNMALNPFIQLFKPVSPLAWLPIV
ncbi:MAG TPA: hypothetical protein VIK52_04270, partial [Opitutaceae bacterium]